ncbi:MAG TPA: PH domain-containing protein [Coriobacteriia bacterium]
MASLHDSVRPEERVVREGGVAACYYYSNGLAALVLAPLGVAVLWLVSVALRILLTLGGAFPLDSRIVGLLALIPWLALLDVLGWLAYRFLEASAARYVLTDSRLLASGGFFAPSSTDLPLSGIRDVRATQPLLGRAFNYGSVIVESAETLGQTLLRYVSDPEGWAADIEAVHDPRPADVRPSVQPHGATPSPLRASA